MHSLATLLNKFRTDERGAFLAIFGILAIVLIAVSGAVIDYTGVEQARTRAQLALDAAALALQPAIYTDNDTEIETKAQDLLINRIADDRIEAEVTDVDTNTANGDLTLTARLNVPLYFVALVGIDNMDVQIRSQATRKKLNLEVVMVLDNSGSMADNQNGWAMRMTRLKAAATSAVSTIFAGEATQPNVYMGIVPFNDLVNIGASNASETWMDQDGISSIANDNFDDDDDDSTPFTDPVDRFELYDQLDNVDWEGCVEARPTPYDTNDATPTAATPDTLFVPEFAPDEPSGWNNSYLDDDPAECVSSVSGQCNYSQVYYYCDSTRSYCFAGGGYSGTSTTGQSCSCSTSGSAEWVPSGSAGAFGYGYTFTRTWTCPFTGSGGGTPYLSDREKQERLCKYTGNASFWGDKGPNYDCPSTSILPLTNVAATVTSRINAMVAAGNTNIAQGAIWGFRVLSPTLPFTEGKAYDTTGLSKVMILMTDGDNTTGYQSYSWNMNGSSQPSAYMYRWNGRLPGNTDGEQVAEMNARTLATCTNAKAQNITIYTIGLSSTNATSIQMLKDCASDYGKAYFPAESSDLDDVFDEIANQLALLRLSE